MPHMDSLMYNGTARGISPRATQIIIVDVIFLSLALLAVVLRLYARRIKGHALSLNDYAIIAALVFELGDFVTNMLELEMGKVGFHMTSLTKSEILSLRMLPVAEEPLRNSANSCIKISILHLYLVIFRTQRFRYTAYALIVLVIAYWIGSFVRMFFVCHPLAYLWDKGIVGGTCVRVIAAYQIVSTLNLALDILIIVLPMPVLWKLQMPSSKKLAVSTIFGMGFIICLITIIRIVAISQLDFDDLSNNVIYVNVFCSLEPCLGIVTACLPILQPALAKIIGGNPLEWTRRSISATQSAKTSTTLWSPKWPPMMSIAGEWVPKSRFSRRTKSEATTATWPPANEKRIVRFKDVDWGDYFPHRVNTIPLSTFNCAVADSTRERTADLERLDTDDEALSPCTNRVNMPWQAHTSKQQSVSSQYWD